MATMPSRVNSLFETVKSLLPQVTELHVYLNEFDNVPAFLSNPKIKVYRSQDEVGDLGDVNVAGVSGTPLLYYSTGTWTFTAFNADDVLTENETITLSGAVTGSGTTAITTSLTAASVVSALSNQDISPAEVVYTSQIYPSGGHQVSANQTGTLNLNWDNKDCQVVTMGAGALTIDVDANANEGGTYSLLVHGPSSGSQNLTISGTGVVHIDGDNDYGTATSVSAGDAVRFTFIVGRNRADDSNVIEMYSKDLPSYPA